MIVATAGHIDHGKTRLVRALTGIDTDRLPEEKARGISIDLGFAFASLDRGATVGFVDVPGHERFIRNMLAGVCAIDCALLVVAADDGVMPQTLEHLDILDLLGVRHGIAAITKIDRVSAERAHETRAEVTALLASTALAQAPVLEVSATTGEGIDALKRELESAAAALKSRATEGQHFRFAIDRAFTIAGTGTVVTGTAFNGVAAVGDQLVVSPRGTAVRVRGIHRYGQRAERAQADERYALNLSGAGLDEIARGDWLLHPAIHAPTQRLDARLRVLASEVSALAHGSPVHLHLATADIAGRISIPGGDGLAPGASAVVQIVLDRPVGALHGDRFVLRDPSANRTVGGGVILDPFAPKRRRNSAARSAEIAALESDGADAALAALLVAAGSRGVAMARFERMFNLDPLRSARAVAAAKGVVLGREGRVAVAASSRDAWRETALAALRRFHAAEPQSAGMEVAALHRLVDAQIPQQAFQSIVQELLERREAQVTSNLVKLTGHDATANAPDARLWQAVLPALEKSGFSAPVVADLARALRVKDAALLDFLHRKSRSGAVLRVGANRFYARSTMVALAAAAHALARSSPSGTFAAAQYRDAIGVGRTLAIEILEQLDALGATRRVGDARRAGKELSQ